VTEDDKPADAPERVERGRWKKGCRSPNPGGRPKGVGWHQKVRADLQKAAQPIMAKLAEQALAGDTSAAKLLLDRVLPHMRPGDLPVQVPTVAGGLADQARAIIGAVNTGKLAPAEADDLLQGLGTLARLIEVDELEKRLTALEALGRP
jgi:hypothetical protein